MHFKCNSQENGGAVKEGEENITHEGANENQQENSECRFIKRTSHALIVFILSLGDSYVSLLLLCVEEELLIRSLFLINVASDGQPHQDNHNNEQNHHQQEEHHHHY